MKKQIRNKSNIVVYQAKSGAIELRGDAGKETMWATQAQIAQAFGVDVRTVNEHIKNIYKTGELDERPTIRKFRIVQKEGTREIGRDIQHYNLDMILSVGYRVSSAQATKFRQWATKTLRRYITDGFVIDKKRIATNYEEFLKAVDDMKQLLPAGGTIDPDSVLELVTAFADTWFSLDAYDKDALVATGSTKKSVTLTAAQLNKALHEFKQALIEKNEATELFGQERTADSIGGIIGNVMQSFGGHDLYPTIEEKAAHLLYFIVKNHPFVDGNKRSGAYAFVWFLRRAKILDTKKMTAPALTALTLFVAESDPKHKDRMIRLVLQLLRK